MTPEELNYHKDQLKFSGFGEVPEKDLVKILTGGKEHDILSIEKEFNGKKVAYELNYDRSDQGKYFLNSFKATLKRPGEEDLSQLFYANSRITAKEAFNLMEGRSVQKTYNRHEKITEDGKERFVPIKGDLYNQWVKLDFTDTDKNGNFKMKTFGDKWGFTLEAALKDIPLMELNDKDGKIVFMDSLRKGNLQAGTIDNEGTKETRYVEANPHRHQVNVYDAKMELLSDKKHAVSAQITKPQAEGKAQENKASNSEKQSGTQQSSRNSMPLQEDEAPDIPQQQKKAKRKQSM